MACSKLYRVSGGGKVLRSHSGAFARDFLICPINEEFHAHRREEWGKGYAGDQRRPCLLLIDVISEGSQAGSQRLRAVVEGTGQAGSSTPRAQPGLVLRRPMDLGSRYQGNSRAGS